MPGDGCKPCESKQGVNPLLVLLFCPFCFASGAFSLATAGLVGLPAIMGVPLEHVLAPLVIVGSLLAWMNWPRLREMLPSGSPTPRGVQAHESRG